MRTSRQLLVLLIGRQLAISTRSPSLLWLLASWTWNLVCRRRYLPYLAWRAWKSMATVRVLSRLALVTTPTFVLVSTRASGWAAGLVVLAVVMAYFDSFFVFVRFAVDA